MFRKCNFAKQLYGAANASTKIAAVAETSTRVSTITYAREYSLYFSLALKFLCASHKV